MLVLIVQIDIESFDFLLTADQRKSHGSLLLVLVTILFLHFSDFVNFATDLPRLAVLLVQQVFIIYFFAFLLLLLRLFLLLLWLLLSFLFWRFILFRCFANLNDFDVFVLAELLTVSNTWRWCFLGQFQSRHLLCVPLIVGSWFIGELFSGLSLVQVISDRLLTQAKHQRKAKLKPHRLYEVSLTTDDKRARRDKHTCGRRLGYLWSVDPIHLR